MGYLLVLGAKSDIAKAVAEEYAKAGYDLYLAARSTVDIDKFARDISIRFQRKVACLKLDILDVTTHQAFFNQLEEKPIGVFSAIGYLGDQERAQESFKESETIINTNYTGIVCLFNIFANYYEQQNNGFIIGVSSVAGDRGRKSNYLYGSAKAGFTAYLAGLRNRLHSSKVQVLTVKPGFVATKMTEGMDLPPLLTAQPAMVAKDIFKAQQKGKNTLYTKWIWKWIMLIIRNIPEWQFKKMNL